MKLLIGIEDLSKYKSKDLLPIECEFCKNIFYRTKNLAIKALNPKSHTRLKFCSPNCSNKFQEVKIQFNCVNCFKSFSKVKSQTSKNNFCCSSCAAFYNNKHKTKGFKRSKAEIYIEDFIKSQFTLLNVKTSCRNALPSQLELDIFIPELRLAIEVNGPLHYFPIYGEEKLKDIIERDSVKALECKELGIELSIIDISLFKTWKKTQVYLDSIIQNILELIKYKLVQIEDLHF